MFTRQSAKSLLSGIDFGKLEQTAFQIISGGSAISGRTPAVKSYIDQMDLYEAIKNSLTGTSSKVMMGDDFEYKPTPHCQKLAYSIIDSFWTNNSLGLFGLYKDQLDRNPKTKDLFKGKSTTHHYPWYRRGSKY